VRIVADEGTDRQIVQRLRADGHEVAYVAEQDPGTADADVLALATWLNALLVTPDKDFGELVYRQGMAAAGVLLYRLAGCAQPDKADRVAWALATHGAEIEGGFAVLTPDRLRIRRLW
jgi:predicted nuclease of predicted toxin-antitoxin system